MLAALICLLATFIALSAFQQGRSDASRRPFYLILAALVSGLGIWATHFVAMLAYRPQIHIGYDVQATLTSILAAVLLSAVGWRVALDDRPAMVPLGGAIIGGGIATMHYIGMSAIQIAGFIVWDRALVVVSIALGVVLAAAAVVAQHRKPNAIPWVPTLLLTAAICGLHFTAMAAAVIYPTGLSAPVASVDNEALALIVIAAMLVILAVGLILLMFDRRLAHAQLAEARHRAALAEEIIRAAAERDLLSCELQRQADICSAALDNMAQGLSMHDGDDRLVTYNQRYAQLYGIPAELLVRGTALADILRYLVSEGILPDTTEFYLDMAKNSKQIAGHSEVQLVSGRIIELQYRQLPQGGWVVTHDDVTEHRETDYLATHDGLTGLLNRPAFAKHLDAAAELIGPARNFAVHTIDLDRFKEVNDTLGHPIGDQILQQAAARLRRIVGDHNLVTRLGGDEFAVLQYGVDQPDVAATLASRIVEGLGEPFDVEGHTVFIGASVGIGMASDTALGGGDILKMSDLALYRSKTDSRGTYRFFIHGMDARLRERRQLEGDLRLAVSERQFELQYQPIIDLADGTIICCEALVRWHHPTRGTLLPSEFITIAEGCGSIVPIGEWVLREACREAASWPGTVSVAVNLSPAQFKHGNLNAMIVSALAAADLDPARLELEITEAVLLDDEAWIRTILEGVTGLGVRIAMDDFGIGYSSLRYLRSFPFSKIKIDQSFVADLEGDGDALAIVQATIQLSKKLGLTTTAEGVETSEQLRVLAAEGCTQAQGFLISRPVRATDIPALLAIHNHQTARRWAAG